jgi:hypothetical protein
MTRADRLFAHRHACRAASVALALIGSLALAARAADSRPPAAPGPLDALDGLYWGPSIDNDSNPPAGPTAPNANRRYLVFKRDGTVYAGLPLGGQVLDADFAALCAQAPTRCGRYRLEGSMLRLEWPGRRAGRRDLSVPVDRRGGAATFRYEGSDMTPVPPPRDLRLNGRFTSTTHVSGQAATGTAQTFIAFTPDGRYRKSGLTATGLDGEAASGPARGRPALQQGRYRIDGFRLTLQPEGGAPEHLTLVLDSANPKVLFIDNRAFLR